VPTLDWGLFTSPAPPALPGGARSSANSGLVSPSSIAASAGAAVRPRQQDRASACSCGVWSRRTLFCYISGCLWTGCCDVSTYPRRRVQPVGPCCRSSAFPARFARDRPPRFVVDSRGTDGILRPTSRARGSRAPFLFARLYSGGSIHSGERGSFDGLRGGSDDADDGTLCGAARRGLGKVRRIWSAATIAGAAARRTRARPRFAGRGARIAPTDLQRLRAVWNDVTPTARDAGEPGQYGWTVYSDDNANVACTHGRTEHQDRGDGILPLRRRLLRLVHQDRAALGVAETVLRTAPSTHVYFSDMTTHLDHLDFGFVVTAR